MLFTMECNFEIKDIDRFLRTVKDEYNNNCDEEDKINNISELDEDMIYDFLKDKFSNVKMPYGSEFSVISNGSVIGDAQLKEILEYKETYYAVELDLTDEQSRGRS